MEDQRNVEGLTTRHGRNKTCNLHVKNKLLNPAGAGIFPVWEKDQ